MFSANDDIDHYPTNAWIWYTPTAAEAAANSNLALGNHGPDAINAYMEDFGPDNQLVGHRRWLLYSRAQEMGTGDVPVNGAFNSANAVWVIGNFKPAPTPQFVAWPNRGFIPHTLCSQSHRRVADVALCVVLESRAVGSENPKF